MINFRFGRASAGLRPLLRLKVGLATIVLLGAAANAQIGPYPDPYDPTRLLSFDLVMDPANWELIRFDLTYDIEVPALFSAEGEAPILVSVRRKSAMALPSELNPQKISMKIDINEYVSGQQWHGVKKLSLENGDDVNVVTEGFAWYLHRIATGHAGSSYDPGLAAWVRVTVNGQDLGVYVNVEQPDKQFLKNRGTYVEDETWFYKQDGVDYVELKVGDPESPTYDLLCYSPFRVGSAPACPSPDDEEFVRQLKQELDLQAMMTAGAISAFTSNPDALFSKGKNFYFLDSLTNKRSFAPWDLDSAFGNLSVKKRIYDTGKGPGSAYEDEIVDHPSFRPLYDATMHGLLDGPFQEATLISFLDQTEALLAAPLAADPNNQIGSGVAAYFDKLRAWVPGRIANVRVQLPPPSGTAPGKATSPSPANGTTGVNVTTGLSWSAGSGASSHDVYFGTNPNPGAAEFQGNQLATTFDPGPLLVGVTYTWRIDEVNQYGTTIGDVWSYSTQASPGSITLSATGRKVKGRWSADLSWTGATTSTVDVFRDGVFLVNVGNSGAYTDSTSFKGGGSLTYHVCEPGGACSNTASVQF